MNKKEREMHRKRMIGKNNPRWNNGSSEYPKHCKLKKNRIELLEINNYKCELCYKPAEIAHHLDNRKDNHNLNNLMPLCKKCHYKLHSGRKNKTSKYMRLYGFTLKELSKMFNYKSDIGILYFINNYKEIFEKELNLIKTK